MHLVAQGSEDEMEKDKEIILNAEIDCIFIKEYLQIKVRIFKILF